MKQFDGIALALIKGSNENVERVFFALETLSLTATTFIEQQKNDTKPDGFVTIPNVEHHLGSARRASQAILLGYTPRIEGKDEYNLWIEYVADNIGWMEEAYDVNPARPPKTSPSQEFSQDFFLSNIWRNRASLDGSPFIVDEETYSQCPTRSNPNLELEYTYSVENPENGLPLAPLWMASPPPHPNSDLDTTNFNVLSNPSFRIASKTIAATEKATFEDICEDPDTFFHPNAVAHRNLSDLYTLISVPAWNGYGSGAALVGYFFAIVPWRIYLSDILEGFETVRNLRRPVLVYNQNTFKTDFDFLPLSYLPRILCLLF